MVNGSRSSIILPPHSGIPLTAEQIVVSLATSLAKVWNRDLPPNVRISARILWPILIAPIALINQLVTPHPIWIVLLIAIGGLYTIGYYWVRSQAQTVSLRRVRVGVLLVAGDTLREEFDLRNDSNLPVLWAEFFDQSNLPDYQPGRVVACGANSSYRWHAEVECRRRGVYQLGPHQLTLGDPFGLFTLTMQFDQTDAVLIYPRVAHLPQVTLPQGNTEGAARRRRPLWGALPSASVREHQPTDSLRYIHWPVTAHRGVLMVKELEIEPSGAVWIVLDLNERVHAGEGEQSTLETAIVAAASIAAELLNRSDRRTVGLLTLAGGQQLTVLAPQAGQAQLWAILAALAPVQPTNIGLAEFLHNSLATLGRRGSLIVITPQTTMAAGNLDGEPSAQADQDWVAEVVHLQALGLAASVLLITAATAEEQSAEGVRMLLARYNIPLQTLQAGTRLPAALTFRRKRKVIRSTPTGGAVTYEVDEEVG